MDKQDTRQNTRVEEVCCTKCFIVSNMSFHVYFDKQVHKKLEKIESLNFAKSNMHQKTNARGSFKTYFFF